VPLWAAACCRSSRSCSGVRFRLGIESPAGSSPPAQAATGPAPSRPPDPRRLPSAAVVVRGVSGCRLPSGTSSRLPRSLLPARASVGPWHPNCGTLVRSRPITQLHPQSARHGIDALGRVARRIIVLTRAQYRPACPVEPCQRSWWVLAAHHHLGPPAHGMLPRYPGNVYHRLRHPYDRFRSAPAPGSRSAPSPFTSRAAVRPTAAPAAGRPGFGRRPDRHRRLDGPAVSLSGRAC